MKQAIKYITPLVVAILAIILIEPIINQQRELKKYDFKVNTTNGIVKKEDFKGKALAIYFGYMFCPDVCPTSLSSLAYALNGFSEEHLEGFAGIFISVDPDRDEVEKLDEYAKYFHKNFIGATSDKANIDDITKRYESYYQKVYLEDSKIDYSISHTSYIYIFDKNGKFVEKVDHFTNPKQLKEVLEKVL